VAEDAEPPVVEVALLEGETEPREPSTVEDFFVTNHV
jgi:hypothetical protein